MSKNKTISVLLVLVLVFMIAAVGVACAKADSSGTNNQTAGVDESDMVKVTDDGYIFKAQYNGLTVSRAEDGQVEVLVKEKMGQGFNPQELLITDSLLILFGYKTIYSEINYEGYQHGRTVTFICLFDLAALKSASGDYLLRQIEFFGQFYTARMFENRVYLVTRLYSEHFYDGVDSNYFKDSLHGASTVDIASDSEKNSRSGFVVAAVDLGSQAQDSVTAKMYRGEHFSDIYCSPYAIYIISTVYVRNTSIPVCGIFFKRSSTMITRLSLKDLSEHSSQWLDGSVLNRYSLYDNGQTLFVAMTAFDRYHYIRAYDTAKRLKEIGCSIGVAKGERLYSATFEGSEGYIVTFRQVDPLFKFDLSDPTDIKLLGELKIDGYSTHLQNFGEGRMIGIGFESGFDQGLKVTLFDTTGDKPLEVNSILFSEEYGYGVYSEATRNPKAILSEVENNIFVFPMEYVQNYNYIQGAVILGVVDGNLRQIGFLYEPTGEYNIAWRIIRVVRIGDYLYAISNDYIMSFRLDDFSFVGFVNTDYITV